MRKIIFLFFLCLCIQSCIRCYKEKEYLFEKSQYEEKINIIGIDDSFIIGTKLTFFIDKIIISKGLSLNNIKIISLTATPPYDADLKTWQRYIDLCGKFLMD